jgi:TATA-binding protein-associated factor Taf7
VVSDDDELELVEEAEAEADDSSEQSDRTDEEGEVIEQEPEWFDRVKLILNHLNESSKSIMKNPGYCVSIDEQMKKFKGWSNQTH